jgi:electron transfer flavoprotein alpha subunit
MTNILVYIQHEDSNLSKASLVALSAAEKIKSVYGASNIFAVCLGANAEAGAKEVAKFGVNKVVFSQASELNNFRPMAYSQALLSAIEQTQAEIVVAAASSNGKDFMPRAAAKLSAGQASEIVAVNPDKTFRRPIYAGNAFADVSIETNYKFITVRGTAFDPAKETGGSAEVSALNVSFDLVKEVEFVSADKAKLERPELSDAAVVVSGGRALQSAENFQKYMFPLADALGAAVGASRAAVDSGYAPNDWQVGQTGKVVAPQLYIAVGISGAIQHLAGMKDSKVIVAINKDPEAPIYEIADYGLVADLFEVLEPLTKGIELAKN